MTGRILLTGRKQADSEFQYLQTAKHQNPSRKEVTEKKTAGHGRKDEYPRQGANNPKSTKEIVGQDENVTTGGSVPVKIDAEELLSIWAASDESARSDLLPIARGWVVSSWRQTHTFRRMQIFRSKSLVC